MEKKIKFNHQEAIIQIDNNIVQNNWNILDQNKRYIIITDKNVAQIYKQLLNNVPNGIAILALKPTENIKSINTYEKIIKNFILLNVKKDDIIIAFGGSSIQQLSNFIASTYLNGMEIIQIPTTLLAQINSSIIGNNKLLIEDNNIIGTNNLPSKIIIDPILNNTLPLTEKLNGISEIIKLGILKDSELLNDITENKIFENSMNIVHIIDKCLEINYLLSIKKEYLNYEENLLYFGQIYNEIIKKSSKKRLSYYEVKLLSMYFEIKNNLKDKLLNIYEKIYDIKEINTNISLLTNIINKNIQNSNIEIIKFGQSKLKRDK